MSASWDDGWAYVKAVADQIQEHPECERNGIDQVCQ
jgi:hypothetical protein